METNVDRVIAKYADRCSNVYILRTAGSYTWYGILAQFLHEIDQVREDSDADTAG